MKATHERTQRGTHHQAARAPGLARPAAAAPAKTQSAPALRLKRILVPTDFSGASLKAIRYAVPLAEKFGATICLVYVLEKSFLAGEVQNAPQDAPDHDWAREAREKLYSLAADEIEELVPVNAQVRIGKPYSEIVDLARELEADLIIIATHGYTGLKHALLGSTAERVVRHASCPVLTVRDPEREFV